NVNFGFIAMQDKPEKINSFLKKTDYTIPIYEANSKFSKEIHPQSYPTTYILNKKGEIVLLARGASDWNAPAIHQLLDKLIAESDLSLNKAFLKSCGILYLLKLSHPN